MNRRVRQEEYFVETAPVTPQKPVEEWKLKISRGQLVLAWFAIAMMMVTVFLTGLFSGRNQGIHIALSEQGREAMRLPLAHAVVPSDSENATRFDSSQVTKSLETAKPQVVAKTDVQDVKYDFSKSIVSPSAQTSQVVASTQPSKAVVAPQPQQKAPTLQQPSSAAPVTNGNFFVQLGTYKSMEEAASFVGQLDRSKFAAKVQEAAIAGKSYFRVLIGPFKGKQEAEESLKALKSSVTMSSEPFVRQL